MRERCDESPVHMGLATLSAQVAPSSRRQVEMATLIVGWAFMAAFYVVFIRGYSTPDPARAAGWAYRKRVAGRYGLLPPSSEPIGLLLWVATFAGFVGAICFFVFGDRFVGASNALMVSSFLLTLWRDDKWLKLQPEYKAAVEAAKVETNE